MNISNGCKTQIGTGYPINNTKYTKYIKMRYKLRFYNNTDMFYIFLYLCVIVKNYDCLTLCVTVTDRYASFTMGVIDKQTYNVNHG